jgi:hypothetical protein
VGSGTLYSNTTGTNNTAAGRNALYYNTTGNYNTAVGTSASVLTTTGSANTTVGYQAGYSGTTSPYNTCIGYRAGYSADNATGLNTFVGFSAGDVVTTGYANTFVGGNAGDVATSGSYNVFVGYNAGGVVSTGSKHTILGSYSGNSNGLDIRTSSNYIVLSDGDGVPQIYNDGVFSYFGIGGTSSTYTGAVRLNGADAANRSAYIQFNSNGPAVCYVGIYRGIQGGSAGASNNLMCMNTSGGVYLNGASATSWTAVSDETRKVIIEDITDAANKVSTLRAVIGRLKVDGEGVRRPYLIAQDVQAVLPEAVSEAEDKDGPLLGLSYTEVIPLLVAAIKELKAELDAVKVEIAALKAQ